LNEEELADILEVIYGIAHAFNLVMDKVLKVKADKLEKRGGFNERIILEKVIE
jgi:predicted house-cleaning noncanonical NTP pyrophosphatase (MazG superfamily)